MEEILSKRDRRLIRLIEILIDNTSLSHRNLKEKLNINSRTLNNTIAYGNDILRPLQITKTPKEGINLFIPRMYSLEFVYQQILRNSTEFELLEAIFFDESHTIESLSESLFISAATLRRMIKKINDRLVIEGFKIEGNPLRLNGKEGKICNFIIHYYLEKSSDEYDMLGKNQLNLIDYLIQTTVKEKNLELTHENLKKIRIWMMVMFNRSKIKRLKQQNFKNLSNNIITENVFAKFNKYNSLSIQNNPYFFSLNQILLNKLNYVHNNLTIQKIHITQDFPVSRVFDTIITNVVNSLKINFPRNKEEILAQLCYMTSIQYGRPYCIYNKHYIFYRKLAKYTLGTTDILFDIFHSNMKDHEITVEDYQIYCYIYTMIIYWDGFIPSIKEKLPKIRVGLYFNVDFKYMDFLKDIINAELSEEIEIILITGEIFDENYYDLILTNKQNLNIRTQCLCFPVFPDKRDIEVLRECIMNLESDIINRK